MSLTDSEKIKNYSNKTDKNIKVADLPKSKMKDKIKIKKINLGVKPGVVKFKNSDMAPGKFSYKKLIDKKIN